ncbi:MAG: hypothetical protein A2023_03995 [Sulfuricurvum sp. GWF2_44_89]|uniref:HPt domain-containing protein n=1 Tax=Sulfuricurvum kujiense TaxID=148813 RepID=A0A2D3WKX6_9BACT|nr:MULTISPECIES: hypothetical protein [Sulfuricurvum]OHD77610.1 MAG: hypothetical protein A2023_03995 [Sulfuricurvum sp. GWF2_44_89]OHD90941.1 MAG: hypothetical protein A2517_07840 [Sulfuricurvum sp. RIFOXYD12_FULL_44_77]OHD92508.1 MAG: hypothetical protein A2552_00695 [Sulfuricurvum sp. RIFOXYD2_FULL_44_160]DAB38384.1 MAG TPA: hypothetical protein CFH83_06200 [Sulfuricurvum kujiense]
MLFYNHKQEFIGIDEEGLKLLNYATLEDLLSVCSDVADLFAKEPGYIHNFKSFGWIDFLLHADSDARSAIVHGNGRTFSCTLQVNSLFLSAEPSNPGYIIDMLHIQSISGDEIKPQPFTPKAKIESKPVVIEPTFPPIETALPNYDHITPTTLSEPGVLDVPTYAEPESPEEPIEDLYAKLSLPLNDEELEKEYFTPEPTPSIEPATEPLSVPKVEPKVDRPMLGDVRYSSAEKEFINTLKVDKSYRFDPNIAAHELGLPVDLIQEFIGDFIQQANEFKEELFEAALKGDMNNLKILSHKLKGVAANLRIEDAFETLSIINTSNDSIEIEANLKYFYSIIEKLEGKEPIQEEVIENTAPSIETAIPAVSDDIYEFAFKEKEPLLIHEEHLYQDVPKNDETPIDLSYDEPVKEMVAVFEESPLEENSDIEPLRTLHYDKVFVSGQLGIELDFFNELVDEYKHDALRAGNEISAAISAFDTHAWKKTASQLKGISDNLRLNEISDELAILSQTNDAQEANKASKRLNSFLEQL